MFSFFSLFLGMFTSGEMQRLFQLSVYRVNPVSVTTFSLSEGGVVHIQFLSFHNSHFLLNK